MAKSNSTTRTPAQSKTHTELLSEAIQQGRQATTNIFLMKALVSGAVNLIENACINDDQILDAENTLRHLREFAETSACTLSDKLTAIEAAAERGAA